MLYMTEWAQNPLRILDGFIERLVSKAETVVRCAVISGDFFFSEKVSFLLKQRA